MGEDHVQELKNMLKTKTKDELISFLQSLNYWINFIPQCAVITEPLSRLFIKKVKFMWGSEQEYS
jgi:hypothetical protein